MDKRQWVTHMSDVSNISNRPVLSAEAQALQLKKAAPIDSDALVMTEMSNISEDSDSTVVTPLPQPKEPTQSNVDTSAEDVTDSVTISLEARKKLEQEKAENEEGEIEEDNVSSDSSEGTESKSPLDKVIEELKKKIAELQKEIVRLQTKSDEASQHKMKMLQEELTLYTTQLAELIKRKAIIENSKKN